MPPTYWDNLVPGGCVTDGVATLKCVPVVLQLIINAALGFAGLTALFLLIYSGIKYIMSAGDAKQAEGARKTITYTIIGLVIILFSFFIVNFIGYITGAKCVGFINQQGC